jgi:ABC-2 type transport system permease protein
MSKLAAIIRHEFRLAAANKAFVILTILGPFLILAITVVPSMISSKGGMSGGSAPVAISSSDAPLSSAIAQALEAQGRKTRILETGAGDLSAEKSKVVSGTFSGLVVIAEGWEESGAKIYTNTGTDAVLYGTAGKILDSAAREKRIAASGIDRALAASLMKGVALEVLKLGADASEKSAGEGEFMSMLFTALGFVMMLYMTVLLYGQMIGRSVVQEKTSKTVEVMLSSVSSRELMTGKILGLGLAGILQYGIWVSVALILVKVAGPALHIALPPAMTPANLLWLVAFFILAFFLYAAAYAALGAASEDEYNLGQLAWPLLIFLIFPLVMIGSFVMNPNSPVAVVLSIFPMTSPIVMLIRILIASPPVWQIGLCLVLLALSIYGMSVLAAKIFRVGILMSGKRVRLGEVLRWIRVK